MQITNVIINFRRHLKRRNYSAHTVKYYLYIIKQYVVWLDVALEQASAEKIDAYIDRLHRKQMHLSSINLYLVILRVFYNYLKYDEQIQLTNPVRGNRRLRVPKPLPKFLRQHEVKQLIEAIGSKRDMAMFKLMLRCGLRVEEVCNLTLGADDPYLKGVITLAHETGMRKEEILSLKWDQVDLHAQTLKLVDTKTGPRTVPLSSLTIKVLRNYLFRWGKGQLSDEERKKLPYVFLNRDGNDRIKDFRGAWNAACKKAGLEGRLFHDLRRTAVRNMVRSRVSEHTAMKISGHKTRAVFDRYDIVSEKDIEDASAKVEDYINGEKESLMERRKKVVPIKRTTKSKLIKGKTVN